MSPDSKVIILTFLSVSVSFYLFLYFIIIPDFWSAVGFWVDKAAGPGAIIVAVIIFILTQRSDRQKRDRDERERMCNSYNAMQKELEDHRDAFTNPDYSDDLIKVDENAKFVSRVLVTDAYDSLLYSGLFSHFETETQNALSNFYLTIKSQNELLDYMAKFRDSFFLNDTSTDRKTLWKDIIKPYHLLMVLYQRDIMEDLDDIEASIQKALLSLTQKRSAV